MTNQTTRPYGPGGVPVALPATEHPNGAPSPTPSTSYRGVWVLWGRYKGTPLRIMDGTLAEVRRECTYRSLIESNPGALTDLRVRKAADPYDMRRGSSMSAYWDRDLEKFAKYFEERDAIRTGPDGFQWIDETRVASEVLSAYRLHMQYGYANGLI